MFFVVVIDAVTLLVSVLLWLCTGEGCSRSHAAADVAGEGGSTGKGD